MTGREKFDELMNNWPKRKEEPGERLKREQLNLARGWLAAFYHTNPDATSEDAEKAWDAWLNDPVMKQLWEEHVEVTAKVMKRKKDFLLKMQDYMSQEDPL